MKMISAITVIFLALTTFANESETCKANSHDANCTQKKEGHDDHGAAGAHGGHKAAKDWTDKRVEQVSQILVQPEADKTKADRPAKVKLTTPNFLAKIDGTTTKLSWAKSDLAQSYHVQVSKDAGFNNRSMMIVDAKNVSDTSYEVTNLEPNTKYFWRVAAFNGDMATQFTKSTFTSSAFSTK